MKDALVAAAIAQVLSQIRTANGYATNIGAEIRHGSPAQVEPGVLFLSDEQEDDVLEQKGCNVTRRQPFTAEVTLPCTDATRPAVARSVVSDICRALWPDEESSEFKGLLAARPVYAGRRILPRTSGQALVTVQVLFQVKFVFNLSNP